MEDHNPHDLEAQILAAEKKLKESTTDSEAKEAFSLLWSLVNPGQDMPIDVSIMDATAARKEKTERQNALLKKRGMA